MKSLIPGVLLGVGILGVVLCLVQPEDSNECPGGICKPKVAPPATPKKPDVPAKPKNPKPH